MIPNKPVFSGAISANMRLGNGETGREGEVAFEAIPTPRPILIGIVRHAVIQLVRRDVVDSVCDQRAIRNPSVIPEVDALAVPNGPTTT